MTVGLHPRFSGYIPPVPSGLEAPQLVALKIEGAPAPLPATTMFDVLLEDRDRLFVMPFIEMRDGVLLLPEAYASYAQLFTDLQPRLRAFDERFRGDRQASLELFAADAEIVEWANAQQQAPFTIVPGLAPYGVVFDLIDRYRFAATIAFGRRIADLNPGCGYGRIVLGERIASYAAIPPDARSERLLNRFTYASPSADMTDADVVLAFETPPEAVRAMLARVRELLGPNGRAIVTSRGEPGRAALADAGLSPAPLVRPGLESIPPLPDFFAVIEPQRVYPSVPIVTVPVEMSRRPLSVLFALRPSATRAFGGDVVQVRMTAKALEARGHRVVVSTDPRPDTSGFDIVHLTNFTSVAETLEQARSVRDFHGPIVMMPIFIDHADETVWGMQAAADAMRYASSVDDLRFNQRRVAERDVAPTVVDGRQIPPPPSRIDMHAGYTQQQREIAQCVDYFIANAYSEMYCIARHLTTEIPFSIVPSCCDPEIYHPGRAQAFVETYNLSNFILSTGRIEARKQQLTLMQLARRWPERPLVLIGRNADIGYGALIRVYWSGNVTMIGHMSEEALAGAYAAARVVAMPSWDEVVSLSAVNAAACGASLVLTRNGFEHEYMGDDALYCDPGDTENIAAAIDHAWTSHDERYDRRMALSDRVRRDYIWARAAQRTEEAYYRVLADNPRGRQRMARP